MPLEPLPHGTPSGTPKVDTSPDVLHTDDTTNSPLEASSPAHTLWQLLYSIPLPKTRNSTTCSIQLTDIIKARCLIDSIVKHSLLYATVLMLASQVELLTTQIDKISETLSCQSPPTCSPNHQPELTLSLELNQSQSNTLTYKYSTVASAALTATPMIMLGIEAPKVVSALPTSTH
jgi:hypothetical protein